MPSKKGRSEPPWLVILEDIRSQNRATLEAVEASRMSHDEKLDRFAQETRSRSTVFATAIQSTNRTVESLGRKVGSLEQTVGSLGRKVGSLEQAVGSLGQEVGTLEQTVGSLGQTVASTNKSVAALDRRLEQSDEQNRLRFAALEEALQRIDQESRSRDASLELAVRDVKVAVQQNSVDIRDLTGKVEALSRLEERVSALERRGA
jgi:chromosome segregation ATPase